MMSEIFLETWLFSFLVLGVVAITGMVIYAMYLSDKNNKASMKADLKNKEISFELESEISIKKDEPVHETDSSK